MHSVLSSVLCSMQRALWTPLKFLGLNEINFRVIPKARQVVVRIVNSKTGELVNQIPQEYLLRMAEEVNGK